MPEPYPFMNISLPLCLVICPTSIGRSAAFFMYVAGLGSGYGRRAAGVLRLSYHAVGVRDEPQSE